MARRARRARKILCVESRRRGAKINVVRGAVIAFGIATCAACATTPPPDARVTAAPALDQDLRDWVAAKSISPERGLVRDPWLFDERYPYAVKADVKTACEADDDEACELAWMQSHNDHVRANAERHQAERGRVGSEHSQPARSTTDTALRGAAVVGVLGGIVLAIVVFRGSYR
jgi:hypothetical protein